MTANTLLDLGVSQRQSTFRFDLTDQTGFKIGELTASRDSPAQLSVDTSRAITRTVNRVVLPPGELNQVDLIHDRVRLVMLLEDGTEWPLGWYVFTSPSEEVLTAPIQSTSHSNAYLDLVDQLMIVDQQRTAAVTIAPGVVITDSIIALLASLPVTVNVTPSSQAVGAEALTWAPGTSTLSIINELATMLGYTPLYFDNTGVGQLIPMPDPLFTDTSEVLDYSKRISRATITRSSNLLDLPNRFIVIGSGASGAPVVGVYDIPPDAPHSAANRGFIVAYSEQQQGVATNDQAKTAAAALGRRSQFAYETISFTSAADPRHDHFNIIAIEDVSYLEMNWTLTLAEGMNMQHSVRRTYAAT